MLEKCRYCGCADAKSLKQCLFCGSVAYCSDEHQQFDWKRHKPVCKQTQTEMQRRLAAASAGPSSCTTYTQTDQICSTLSPSPDPSPPRSESSATFAAGMGQAFIFVSCNSIHNLLNSSFYLASAFV
ncbi:MYND finger [Ancylostoma caninum]|uniref:MYND finger n=1 Tax=Ancylostoma caninum TaxID=29170 RepID=A0A368GTX9_ANCCA|nr:MYND finger [Ancylostoma caninum]